MAEETEAGTIIAKVGGWTQTWTPEDRVWNVLPRTRRGTMFRVQIPPGYVYKFYVQGYAKKGTPLYEAQEREMADALAEFEAEYGEQDEDHDV